MVEGAPIRVAAGVLVGVLSIAACNAITGLDRFEVDPSLVDAGGADAGMPCTTILDCPGVEDQCQARACVSGRCVIDFVPEGTSVPGQTAGDCHRVECDGAGQARTVVDTTDVPNDGLECTQEECSPEGTSSSVVKTKGSPCVQGGGAVCDGSGACVECNFDADCAGGGPCAAGHCVSPQCTDGAKNGNESDIDCGGSDCAPCTTGQSCKAKIDCESQVCKAGLCQAPTCQDGAANGAETDVDCGGPDCADCADGKGCLVAGDCTSGVCVAGVCQAPKCDDGVKNGAETDRDCGGGCPGCATGKPCLVHADCQSEACLGGTCSAIVQIAAGTAHACALLGDGTVVCWGSNTNGELGDGTTVGKTNPQKVPGLSGVTQISLGINANDGQGAHTCARLSDGTAQCWGRNNGGQVGDGTIVNVPSPKTVAGLVGVTQIVAGGRHTCARLAGGAVSCWGANGNGQVGNNTLTNATAPVSVAGVTASSLSLGDTHSCALLTTGQISCWGDGNLGQLGDGLLTDSLVPMTVPNLTGITQVASGKDFLFARMGGAPVYAWGENSDGQLGLGNTTLQSAPVQVPGLVAVAMLAGGTDGVANDGDNTSGGHACAVFQDGTLQCFGHGLRGQLGTGGVIKESTPKPVTIPPVAEVSLGLQFSCARLVTGALRCWGRNDRGQLGTGASGPDVTTPTPVVFP